MQRTPKKRGQVPDGTPQKTPLEMLDSDFANAMDHYFSPKKKSPRHNLSPGRKQGKSPKKIERVNFEEDEESESEDSAKCVAPAQSLKCNLENLKKCFTAMDATYGHYETKEDFDSWMELTKDFNLLLHGVGSNRELLNDFCRNELEDFHYLVCNGFQSELNVRSIFESIVAQLKLNAPFDRKVPLSNWAITIKEELDKKEIPIFLLVNSIDGRGLRERVQQEALSLIARSKYIRIIATVDHVNATIMWDQRMRDSFNWLYIPCSTMQVCSSEILAGESKILGLDPKQSGWSHTVASLEVFWQATTANARKILQQLAIHAPNMGTRDKNVEPLMLPNFCKILRAEFATTSEPVLRQQLIEFLDHHLIHMDREGCIQLAVDRTLLISFLDLKTLEF